MINRKDVLIVKLNDIINIEEKQKLYQLAIDFVKNNRYYYNRQQWTDKNKIDKAYRWYLSEFILSQIIIDNNLNKNNKIIIDWLSNDFNKKTDEFDIEVNWKTIDIKSSGENTSPPYEWYQDYLDFLLNKRNFILPVNQSKKDYIIQIIYDYNNEYVYIIWYIDTNILIKQWKKINLKVSYDWYQETYMYNLKYWNPLEYLFNN